MGKAGAVIGEVADPLVLTKIDAQPSGYETALFRDNGKIGGIFVEVDLGQTTASLIPNGSKVYSESVVCEDCRGIYSLFEAHTLDNHAAEYQMNLGQQRRGATCQGANGPRTQRDPHDLAVQRNRYI